MKAAEARQIGQDIAAALDAGRVDDAYRRLAPVLEQKVPFHQLDCLAETLGAAPPDQLDPLFSRIAQDASIGGWVVIATALRQSIPADTPGALVASHRYILQSDVWYGCDSIAERVHGPALVEDFNVAIRELDAWRADSNRWARRAIGVGVHVWAKRAKGDLAFAEHARRLLAFLQPLFTEREIDAVKGIGWGLKTIGRYYPDELIAWLPEQIAAGGFRSLMLRKALTYLPDSDRRMLKALAQ